jgi:hypothetical protein
MSFYLGCYLIEGDSLEPLHDGNLWELPDTAFHSGHMSDTSNVEELMINPEDMDLVPTKIQFGSTQWGGDEGFNPTDKWTEFYSSDEAFYLRGFSPTDSWTPSWYASGNFYVRGFSPTDYWTPSWYASGNFYVRSFTGTDHWTPSWYAGGNFYVRNFTATPELWQFYLHETGYC